MHRSNILEPSPVHNRSDLISPIVPGYPYSFTNFAEYLETYARSHFAITHRKAGWDCFRHLEIMASGSAPLMLDASDIPEFSMVHYPKHAFRQILTNARTGGVPSMRTHEALAAFMTEHLTTQAMIHYLLQCTQITDVNRVLFVDQQHPNAVDYLSTLTLVGLKEHFGNSALPTFPLLGSIETTTAMFHTYTAEASARRGCSTPIFVPTTNSPAPLTNFATRISIPWSLGAFRETLN